MNTIFILQFFKLNKLLINEAEDTIEAGLEEESKVLFGQERIINLHFLKECVMELLSTTEEARFN